MPYLKIEVSIEDIKTLKQISPDADPAVTAETRLSKYLSIYRSTHSPAKIQKKNRRQTRPRTPFEIGKEEARKFVGIKGRIPQN